MGDMRTQTAILADVVLERTDVCALVRAFVTCMMQSPTDAFERYCADEISVRLLQNPVAPGAPGHFQGKAAATFAIRTVLMNLEVLSFQVDDLIIDGHEAALRWRIHVQHRATGVTGDLAVFDHIVIRSGLITGYSSFFDTDGFSKLMAGERQPLMARASNRQRLVLPPDQGHMAPAVAAANDLFARNRREHFLRDYWTDRLKFGSTAIESRFTENCEMHFIGDPSTIAFARLHRGIAETRALIDATDREFEILSFRIEHILVDGDRAALHWRTGVRHRGTSARGHLVSFDHILLRGDRIAAITGFFDTAETIRWMEG